MRKLTFLFALIVSLVYSQAAFALVHTFELDPFTGDPAYAQIKVDDETANIFRLNIQVIAESVSGNIGDITGVFFNFSPLVTPDNITSILGGSIVGFGNNTNDLGGGVNLTGGGPSNPGLFDVGLRYEGFNIDDIQEIEFTIDRTDSDLLSLTLDDFTGFGLRLQTVGPDGGSRGGSSKLAGFDYVPENSLPHTPEPATMILISTGLLGFAFKRRSLCK